MKIQADNYVADLAALKALTGVAPQAQYLCGTDGYVFFPNAEELPNYVPANDGSGCWVRDRFAVNVTISIVPTGDAVTGTELTDFEHWELAYNSNLIDYSCFYGCVKSAVLPDWNNQSQHAKDKMLNMLIKPNGEDWPDHLDTKKKRKPFRIKQTPSHISSFEARLTAFEADINDLVEEGVIDPPEHAEEIFDKCQELKNLRTKFVHTLSSKLVDYFNDANSFTTGGYTDSGFATTYTEVVDAANDILGMGVYDVKLFR